MHYLNPAPDQDSLSLLYGRSLVDKVDTNVTSQETASAGTSKRTVLGRYAHRVNGLLRGHPHDWPDEPGEGRSILDFGCLDGAKLLRWQRLGWQVAGIDVNRKGIEVARSRLPEGRFWCGDLLHLRIGQTFDYIRADNVVEHLLDPVAYIKALAKLLKRGGQLRVFVPNGAALSARLFGRYSYVYWMPFHLNLFSPETLRIAFQRAGFERVACRAFSPIGSWSFTQLQLLFSIGSDAHRAWRAVKAAPRLMRVLSLLNYPGETICQWLGLCEEVVGTGVKG